MQRKYKWYIALASVLAIGTIIAVIVVFTSQGESDEGSKEKVIANTINGQIKGKILHTSIGHKKFYAFRGIPFAEPPLDDLRFAAPIPAQNWTGVLDATRDKGKCIQLTDVADSTEDCLYINVYTPSLKKTNQTVMVYVYGGFFEIGDGTYGSYTPDYFLEEDVIVVTFNYRIGIFGFYSTEDEIAPGNAGLKDQVLALKWVNANIAAFGGNPDLVTLFGQSAGAASVSYLMQTDETKGLFRATIMESGSSLCEWSLAKNKSASVFDAAKMAGINATTSSDLLEEFRKLNMAELEYISFISDTVTMAVENPLNGLLYSPSMEPSLENSVITGKSYENLNKGSFHQVPSIIGFNSNEALFLENSADVISLYLKWYALSPNRFTPSDMNSKEELSRTIGKNISSEYFKNSFFPSKKEIIRYISEDQFERGINKMAELQSKYSPVYFYYFSYEDKNSNHTLPGACHSDEVDYLWAGRGKDSHPLRKKMVKLWSNFAKYLNPTPTQDTILDNVIWKQFSSNAKCYLNIGDTLIPSTKEFNQRLKYWDDIYETYGQPPFDTY